MSTAERQGPRIRRPLVKAVAAGGVAGFVALAGGVAFARFSATRPVQSHAFSAGTVRLTNNVTGACNVTRMLPGANPSPCTLTATYGGTSSGWMALDVLIETQSGNGGTKLYNPADPTHDLQIAVTSSSPSVSYTVPATATTCPAGAPSGSTCYEIDDELVSTSVFTTSSPTVSFSTTVSLPGSTTTGYRGGAAQVILTAHAAQSGNNAATGCTAGQTCAAVHWS